MNLTTKAVAYTAIGIGLAATMGAAKGCSGNTNPAVYDGTTFSTANYGLYAAGSKASEKCRWYITVVRSTSVNKRKPGRTQVIASGGKHDQIVAGSAYRGGVLHTNCGTMARVN